MATRYFCDRCNRQVLTPEQLKLAIFPDAEKYWEGVHIVEKFELCEDCITHVKQIIATHAIFRP